MHELSIAVSLIESVEQAAAGAVRVNRVGVRVGALSGVVAEALRFAYDVAAAGTLAEGSALEIEDVPVTVYCPRCAAEERLDDPFRFVCPRCGTPTADIRQGRQLELAFVEIETDDPAPVPFDPIDPRP